MIIAFDTYYYGNSAKTVCIAFENWEDAAIYEVFTENLNDIEEYRSGEFYRREMPCILSLYKKLPSLDIEAIVVDGFVYLDDDDKYGLGAYLYDELGGAVPVIGVAKTNFATIIARKSALIRGESKKPLYITSIGMDLATATDKIKEMHGEFRIPTLLKELDRLTKED